MRARGLPGASVPADGTVTHFGWLSKFYGAGMAADGDATLTLPGWTLAAPPWSKRRELTLPSQGEGRGRRARWRGGRR